MTVAGIRSGAGPIHCKLDIKLVQRFFFNDRTPQIAPAKRRSYTFTHLSAFSITQGKSRVISIAQTTAWQLQRTDIRVNALCPGLIETGMTAPLFDQASERGTKDKVGQLNPLGRYGVPEGTPRLLYMKLNHQYPPFGCRDCKRCPVSGLRCVSFFRF